MKSGGVPGPLMSVALTVLCAVVITAGVLVARLADSGWDPSGSVRAGNRFASGLVPPGLHVINGIGYDGQFNYRLALDPFTRKTTEFGITLDQPARRQQRILYPSLAWLLGGGGDPRAVLWSLIAINAVAVVLIAWAGAALARELRRPAVAGLAFALVPGVLVGLTHDTAEPLAVLAAVCFLVLVRKERFVLATLALTVGMLARETVLLFAIGALGASLASRRKPSSDPGVPIACSVVPILAYLSWQGFLRVWWGRSAVLSAGSRDLGAPIEGLVHAAIRWVGRGARVVAVNSIFATGAVVFIAIALVAIRRSSALAHERWAFLAAGLLALLFRANVWFNFTSFLRALSEATVLGLVVLMGTGARPPARARDGRRQGAPRASSR